MYKALYAFKKTHPTSLSFAENDVFIELPGASGDKNWYYVLTLAGVSGFVPRNYVQREPVDKEKFFKVWEAAKDKVKFGQMADREKGDLLIKLDLALKAFKNEHGEPEVKAAIEAPTPAPIEVVTKPSPTPPQKQSKPQKPLPAQPEEPQASQSVAAAASSAPQPNKFSKKRAAPLPPSSKFSGTGSSNSSPRNSESPDQILVVSENHSTPPSNKSAPPPPRQRQHSTSTSSSNGRRPSIPDPSSDQVRDSSRELLDLVRDRTGLSHVTSQATVILVLNYLTENFQRLDRNVPALLEELDRPAATDKKSIVVSQDAIALEAIFEELTKRKEDDQQRNWMLHKDEHIIRDLLQNLQNVLQNAQKEVCLYVLKKFKYFYVNSLVEYFQMETRWVLRQKLIETFMLMCSLDPLIISLFLSSVLPLELAQDLFQHTENVDRMRHCALLLTVIFSRGEPLPVHYFNQLGETFVNFLLEHIENPLSREHERDLGDVFIGLVLSYNLQFKDKSSSNVTVKCIMRRTHAKAFTEQLLLLLNREEDPTAIVTPHFDDDFFHSIFDDSTLVPTNATHKMVLDIFQDSHCHELFYTNDIYVLIDIIVRQLSDLSQEDVKRSWYANMCHLVLLRSNYSDHLHRFKDLEHCFMRILEEEDSSTEKDIIAKICREIPAFASLSETD